MIDAVVKVGGSLGRGPSLPALCTELARLGERRRLLVVPGGGACADAVRDYQGRFGLSPDAAHWAAVRAMDVFGLVLQDLIPGGRTVPGVRDADVSGAQGRVAVLMPFEALRAADPLPHDWSVTSDAIAAWFAVRSGAALLVLLKDARGMAAPSIGAEGVPTGEVGLDALSRWKGVDDRFAGELRDGPPHVWIVDGERPGLLRELLLTGSTEGVSLVR